MRLPGLNIHSLVPRLVRTCVTLVENRPYSAANGFDSTSTDSTRAARQLEIEVAGRWIVQAGAAHLQRARGRSTALDAQPSVGTANDTWQHRQQRLKVVAGQRLHVHLRAGEQVADRHGLQALGGGVGRQDHLDAFADEGEAHLDQHLLGDAAADLEGRGLGVGESLARCLARRSARRARPRTSPVRSHPPSSARRRHCR